MNFDCIIIGGGISGLTCGLKCAREGLSCAIISAGMSALHFSSGSIDLLGYFPGREVVFSPLDALKGFIQAHPQHPYSKCGRNIVEEGLNFFKDEVEKAGLDLYVNQKNNHFHVTSLGTVKPTFFSQSSVYNDDIKKAFSGKPKIAIINFKWFRDFHAGLVAANLRRNRLFSGCEIISGSIEFPEISRSLTNLHELRSIDIARMFDSSQYIEEIASQIITIAGDCEFIGMPAFIGINNFKDILKDLSKKTGLIIYEIPTLPPSILGMRLDDALKARFAELGGIFIQGDKVDGGKMRGGILDHIHTQNYEDTQLAAPFFVLSSGSFFSSGIISESNRMHEPVFDLMLDYSAQRASWRREKFFDPESHPFLSFGVRTNENFNPFDQTGKGIENLFCTGAILSNYDPIKEGSGGGVAISSGYFAATRIINSLKGGKRC